MVKGNEIIYQIFVRNYSQEGTFQAVQQDLNRLKELGVDIIYLMPIHEIGIKNRKGTWGSPYAIKDYYSISKDEYIKITILPKNTKSNSNENNDQIEY